MKVITEKRLREILSSFDGLSGEVVCSKQYMLEYLIEYQLEEIDTLTVSKLRPMCDAPKTGSDILCVMHGSQEMYVAFYNKDKWEIPGAEIFLEDDSIVGWLPMPIYKPE